MLSTKNLPENMIELAAQVSLVVSESWKQRLPIHKGLTLDGACHSGKYRMPDEVWEQMQPFLTQYREGAKATNWGGNQQGTHNLLRLAGGKPNGGTRGNPT